MIGKTVIKNILYSKKLGIRNKLLLSFITVTVIPIIIVGSFAFYRNYIDIQGKIGFYSTNMIYQNSINIKNFIQKYTQIMNSIITSDEIQESFRNLNYMYKDDKIAVMNGIEGYMFSVIKTRKNIHTLCILPDDSVQFLSAGIYNPVLWFWNTTLYKDAVEADGKYIFTKQNDAIDRYPENDSITIAAAIKNKYDGTTLGVLVMGIQKKELNELYSNQIRSKGDNIFIMQHDGVVIWSLDNERQIAISDDLIKKIRHTTSTQGFGYFKENINGIPMLISCAYIEESNWFVVDTVPYSFLMNETQKTAWFIFIIAVSCAVVSVWIAIYLSRSISQPIYKILNKMKTVEEGNFDISIEEKYTDEMGDLADGFNKMVYRINELINEVYEARLKKKEAEIKSLQAQINPHFLYNTLDSINWMANMINADQIALMVTSLAKLFRLSLNKGKEETTVYNEVQHVKSYITIQQVRYKNKFTIFYDIDDEILYCKTIKLILQPVVENSINHGIEPKEGIGKISIRGRKHENFIEFQIEDDGIGMTEEKIQECFNTPQKPSSGYAIKNIADRIKLWYGDNFGVTIRSSPGKGTIVTLTIPYIKEEVC